MSKKNTVVVRSDAELKKIIDDVLMRQPRKVTSSRVTLAMARQYNNTPYGQYLLKQLKETKLK